MKVKQINTGKLIGGILDTFNRTAFFVTIINTVVLACTFYNTGGGAFLKGIFPFMNMWYFLLFVFILVCIAMVFVYLIITPSYFRFFSHQFYHEDSQLREDIDKIKRKLEID